MSTFTSTLSIATSGLDAAQARAKVVAENVANATTEGYSTREIQVKQRVAGATGTGVSVIGETRVTNDFLINDRMRVSSENAFTAERAEGADRIAVALGEPGSSAGIFGAYAQFENALRDAAATPESATRLRTVVDTAENLSEQISATAQEAASYRSAVDQEISFAVDDVNEALLRLEELNALPVAGITPAVEDERQRLVDRVNDIIPVNIQRNETNIFLYTERGTYLLTENARQVNFNEAGNVGRNQTVENGLSGLSVDGVDITPYANRNQGLEGGRLTALFEQRDVRLPRFQSQLDSLAEDLVSRFAADEVDPTKPAGAAGLFTVGSAGVPEPGTSGLAERLQLNDLFNPAQGGETFRIRDGQGATTEGAAGAGAQLNRYIDALTGARSAPAALGVSGQLSAAEIAASVASEVSFDQQKTADAAIFTATRLDVARDAELNASGVDTDKELQKLLLIEQAYAANSRVIQTVNEMIDELLRLT